MLAAVAVYNNFWDICASSKTSHSSMEIKIREEKRVPLQKLVKLGENPTKQRYIDRSPLSKAANAVLTNEQKAEIAKIESVKQRRASRYFDIPVI